MSEGVSSHIWPLCVADAVTSSSSATKAGIDLLPMIVTQIVILIASGRIIARFGR